MQRSEEQRVIARLEKDMEVYDRIFLVCGGDALPEEATALLCHSQTLGNPREKRLILLSPDAVPESDKRLSGQSGCGRDGRVSSRRISEAETETLCRLYDTYEFSDHFQILSREPAYGGLFNFIDTGMLSVEEMLEALLH